MGALSLCAEPLTFVHDIAPIIYENCASCHRPGEAGPFSLLSYQDVRKHAALIATVTRSRYMPPWLPEQGYGDFAGERRLTSDQIRTIADWVAQGAPQGPPAETPPPPQFTEGWQLGTPDLVIQAPQSFSVPAAGPDVYWNFVFTPSLAQTRWVRAVEIRPGDRRLVHHANLLIDRMASANRAGFPGMDLALFRSPFDPDGHFLFWKPGSPPHFQPPGFAWRLDPFDQLVLNTHFHPSGKPEIVRPSIGLYFTDQPQTRFPLLVQMENDAALDIPARVRDFPVSDDFRLPMDVDVLAVYPHAHYLGKLLEAYATLPDGTRRWLIRIPQWDPNWQAVFDYREPVFLPAGSVVSMRYHYDNSAANVRNPNQPPKRVRGGNQSTDEMAHLWLQVLPRGQGDRRRELQEAVMRHHLEKDPRDPVAHANLGAILLSRLQVVPAIAELTEAVREDPASAESHNMLGLALAAIGRSADGIAEYQAALRLLPQMASARFNLANALAKAGRIPEAIAAYRQLAAADPADLNVKQRLADALRARALQLKQQDQWAEAAAAYRESLGLEPGDAATHNDFGAILMLQGKFGEALQEVNRALALDPENEAARQNREVLLHH